jgi:hypothetical protein
MAPLIIQEATAATRIMEEELTAADITVASTAEALMAVEGIIDAPN